MKKIVIANRGEIALRIIRTCKDMGYKTVALYSTVDKQALHVLAADEAVCIGPGPSSGSYLNQSNILTACEITNADAVHPGYGFLSESAEFAKTCVDAGLVFIGPGHKSIAMLGDKARAKQIARKAKCPVIEGSEGIITCEKRAKEFAQELGFPIFIKARLGGGGRGIRLVSHADEFFQAFSQAKAEAKAAFGDDGLYVEKCVVNPRHVELQIVADQLGHCIHLYERDCSIQRRRQKLIEESPSVALTSELRERMGQSAINIAKEANYATVGTIEFLLDDDKNYYFMEMNTRLQVEHTVTEEVTGIDLVELQIQCAFGKKLELEQKDIASKGHAMQFRINAEDPEHNFRPCPGKLDVFLPSSGPFVRVDSACYPGYTIPMNYDSLIAKVIVKGSCRDQVIRRAKRALEEFYCEGVKTSKQFHLDMLNRKEFIDSDYTISFVDELFSKEQV